MKNFFKKLSFVLAVAMVLTSLAPATASAATKNYIKLNGTTTVVTTAKPITAWIGGVVRNLDYSINGKTSGVAGTWKSSKTSVATINSAGVITPKANGTTTISFTTKDKKTTLKCNVKVRTRAAGLNIWNADATEKISGTAIEVKVGQTVTVPISMPIYKKATAAGGKSASYYPYAQFSDDAIASAEKINNRKFEVTGKSVGETTLTIVANQSTEKNVRANKYYVENKVTIKVVDEFSAKQTGVKKITVSGSDLTNVASDYVLKRGTVTVDVDTVTPNADKTSAVITSKASKLTAGEYTLKFKDNDAVAFTVEEGKVTSIDIPNDTLPLDDEYNNATTATVGYKVYNQFNEDVTKTVSTVNVTSSFGTAEAKTNDSAIKITFPSSKPLIGATGTIVIVDTATGVNFNKTLTLGMKAKADTIDVLGVYNSATGEKMDIKENSTNSNAALLVKVSDQYGGEMSKLDCNSEIAFTFTGGLTGIAIDDTKAVFKDTITIDGTTYVIVPLTAVKVKAGTAQAFFVSTSTGKTANVTITVGANATIKSIDVYPLDSVYGGEDNEFGFTALTEEGTEVKDYDTLSSSYGLTTMSSNYGDFSWRKNSDGSAKLIFKTNGSFDSAIAGNKSLVSSATFVTAGYGTKTITFSIYAPAVPTSIGGIKDVTLGLLNDTVANTVDFVPGKNLVIYDQYGRSMVTGFSDYTVKVEPVDNAGTDDTITATTSGAVAGNVAKLDGTDKYTFSTTTSAITRTYTEKYTITLLDKSSPAKEIEGSSYTLSVSTAPMSILTRFTMNKVADLYDYTVTGSTATESTHATEPVVIGYTAANVAISIPNSKLTLTPGNGVTLATVTGTNMFSASGAAAYITKEDKNASSKQTNVTVTIDNAAGTQLSQDLNVSTVAPAATTIGSNTQVNVSASSVTADTNGMNAILAKLTYSVKDQYGKVYGSGTYGSITAADAKTIQISNVTDADVSGSKIGVTKNNTSSAVITGAEAKDSFVITITLKSNVVITAVVNLK